MYRGPCSAVVNVNDCHRRNQLSDIVPIHGSATVDVMVRSVHVRAVMSDHVPLLRIDFILLQGSDWLLLKGKRKPGHWYIRKFARKRMGEVHHMP